MTRGKKVRPREADGASMGTVESRGRASDTWEETSSTSTWNQPGQGKKMRNRNRQNKAGFEEEQWDEEDGEWSNDYTRGAAAWYEESSYPQRATPQGSRKGSKGDKKLKGRNPHQGKTIAQVGEALLQHSRATTRTAKEEEDIEWLLAHIHETLSNLKTPTSDDAKRTLGKELSEVMFALGTLQLKSEFAVSVAQAVACAVPGSAEAFTPEDIAGLVYGFACSPSDVWQDYYEGSDLEKMLKSLAKAVLQKKAEFGQREIGNTAWAYAKCGFWEKNFVDGICDHCRSIIRTLSDQSMGNLCWALAQWSECEGVTDEWTSKDKLLEEIAGVVKSNAGRYRPPALGLVAWSFAKMGLDKKEVLPMITASSKKRMTAFSLQDIVHLSWGLASMHHIDVELFQMLAEAALELDLGKASAAELANLAWAMAKSRVKCNKLMEKIVEESKGKLQSYDDESSEESDQFQAEQIIMVSWALASHGANCSEFITKVGDWALEDIQAFTVEQLALLAWCFAALRVQHEPFFDQLCQVMLDQDYIEAQSIANIVFSCALLHYKAEEFFDDCELGPEIVKNIDKVPARSLVRAVWAFDVMGIPDMPLTEAVTKKIVQTPDCLPTKVLASFYDMLCGLPELKPAEMMRVVLEKKLAPVVDCIRQFKLSRADLEGWPKLLQQLSDLKVVDCGLMGTQFLEQKLEFSPPSLDFMKRCSAQEWNKSQSFDGKPDLDEVPELYTAIRLELSTNTPGDKTTTSKTNASDFGQSDGVKHRWADEEDSDSPSDQAYEAWVVRWSKDPYFGVPPSAGGFLRVAELADRAGRLYPTAPALEEVCFRIQTCLHAEFGTQSAPECCTAVRGDVNIFTSLVPSVACLCAVWQFKQIFPQVKVSWAVSVDIVPTL